MSFQFVSSFCQDAVEDAAEEEDTAAEEEDTARSTGTRGGGEGKEAMYEAEVI